MCDYSLDKVASRPAQVGDKLVTTEFCASFTRGFSAEGQPNVAVCLLPGTEVAVGLAYDVLLKTYVRNWLVQEGGAGP